MKSCVRRNRQCGVKHFQRFTRTAQPREAFAQRIQQIDMARGLFAGLEQKRQRTLIVTCMHAPQTSQPQQSGMNRATADRVRRQAHGPGQIGSPKRGFHRGQGGGKVSRCCFGAGQSPTPGRIL
jgi:hypothetical protein